MGHAHQRRKLPAHSGVDEEENTSGGSGYDSGGWLADCFARFWPQLHDGKPHHCTRGETETKRQQRLEPRDCRECQRRHQRLRQGGDDAPHRCLH